MQPIAFLGLGVMGECMAQNLLKAGYPVTVYNRTAAKAEPLAAIGAQVAATPRAAAHEAEVIISMVANDDASRGVLLGDEGALAGASNGATVIECSTLSLAWVREVATIAEERGIGFVEAPVMGSTPAAALGTLKFLVGGRAGLVEQLTPLLSTMGDGIFHIGGTGAGMTLKLIQNAMLAAQVAVLGEALVLAEKAGLDTNQAASVLASGSAGSPIVKNGAAGIVAREYGNPTFQLQHMRKDVTYALRLGQEVGAALPTIATVRELYQMAGNLGYDEASITAVSEVLRLTATV